MSHDLIGPWHPIAALLAGRELAIEEMQVAHLEFNDGSYIIFDRAGNPVDRGRYACDQAVLPWSLELYGDPTRGQGKVLHAIFEFGDDGLGSALLHLSYALDGGQRPASFDEAATPCHEPATDRLVIALQFRRLATA